jgi:hypothetical protein
MKFLVTIAAICGATLTMAGMARASTFVDLASPAAKQPSLSQQQQLHQQQLLLQRERLGLLARRAPARDGLHKHLHAMAAQKGGAPGGHGVGSGSGSGSGGVRATPTAGAALLRSARASLTRLTKQQHEEAASEARLARKQAGAYASVAKAALEAEEAAVARLHLQTRRLEQAAASQRRGALSQWCLAGTYHVGGKADKCVPCPAGRFKRGNGEHRCRACPAGRHTPGAGRRQCAERSPPARSAQPPPRNAPPTSRWCLAGRFFRGNACWKCPHGKFKRGNGAGGCRDCPAGQSQLKRGQRRCSSAWSAELQRQDRQAQAPSGTAAAAGTPPPALRWCLAGHAWSGDARKCLACPAGRFKGANGSAGCRTCPAGQSTPGAGARRCKHAEAATLAPAAPDCAATRGSCSACAAVDGCAWCPHGTAARSGSCLPLDRVFDGRGADTCSLGSILDTPCPVALRGGGADDASAGPASAPWSAALCAAVACLLLWRQQRKAPRAAAATEEAAAAPAPASLEGAVGAKPLALTQLQHNMVAGMVLSPQLRARRGKKQKSSTPSRGAPAAADKENNGTPPVRLNPNNPARRNAASRGVTSRVLTPLRGMR